MRGALITLSIFGLLAGCSSGTRRSHVAVTALPSRVAGPFFPNGGRLTRQQSDWYIQKAIAWLQTDRDSRLDGGYILRMGFIYGSDIDHSRPIECVQSDDGGIVTVTIPQRIEPDSEYWMVVHLDARTGQVKRHGARVVSKNI